MLDFGGTCFFSSWDYLSYLHEALQTATSLALFVLPTQELCCPDLSIVIGNQTKSIYSRCLTRSLITCVLCTVLCSLVSTFMAFLCSPHIITIKPSSHEHGLMVRLDIVYQTCLESLYLLYANIDRTSFVIKVSYSN